MLPCRLCIIVIISFFFFNFSQNALDHIDAVCNAAIQNLITMASCTYKSYWRKIIASGVIGLVFFYLPFVAVPAAGYNLFYSCKRYNKKRKQRKIAIANEMSVRAVDINNH